MKIKLLSPVTISKIATGEVVDRPLSVVKELLENSIDAKATDITLTMSRGGRTLISISDNGTGIDKEDLLLAVTRHATSKLIEEDIANILHMGFRGEALASIATAARLHITSRTGSSDQGWTVKLDDGAEAFDKASLSPASHNIRTTVEVFDLFCFMPNRVRFLKPEASEVVACTELVNSLAIVHPQIKFSFNHNDKPIIEMSYSDDMQKRIGEILGDEFIENAVYFDTGENYREINRIRLYGYVSVPTNNRSSNAKILTFVNKRLVKDNFLNKLVRVSYFNTLPEGITPSVVLFFEMPVKCVDVNIHPNKSEVRFSDEKLIREIVINSIRDAIRNTKTTTKIPQKIVQQTQKPVEELRQPSQLHLHTEFKIPPQRDVSKNENKVEEKPIVRTRQISSGHLGSPKLQIANKYVIAENDRGIVIVDQHAAHERIVLEKINKEEFGIQKLLIPLRFDLCSAATELLMSISEDLKQIGITIASENSSEVLVHSIPLLPGNIDIEEMLQDIVNDSEGYIEILKHHKDKFLTKIACHSSIRAGRRLSLEEMDGLLRLIEKTDFASQCIHGRPTYVELSTKYLDRLFER